MPLASREGPPLTRVRALLCGGWGGRPGRQLLLTALLFFIILYYFVLFSFAYLQADYNDADGKWPDGRCKTLFKCLLSTFDSGFKENGGIGA